VIIVGFTGARFGNLKVRNLGVNEPMVVTDEFRNSEGQLACIFLDFYLGPVKNQYLVFRHQLPYLMHAAWQAVILHGTRVDPGIHSLGILHYYSNVNRGYW
jgi:hypothetical protein